MALRESHGSPDPQLRPAMDEWGIYDPSQAGLEALRERLDARRREEIALDGPAIGASMRLLNRLLGRTDKSRTG